MSDFGLICKFADQSPAFAYGAQFGMIAEAMERDDESISRAVNPSIVDDVRQLADWHGYDVTLEDTGLADWVDLTARKVRARGAPRLTLVEPRDE